MHANSVSLYPEHNILPFTFVINWNSSQIDSIYALLILQTKINIDNQKENPQKLVRGVQWGSLSAKPIEQLLWVKTLAGRESVVTVGIRSTSYFLWGNGKHRCVLEPWGEGEQEIGTRS